jgi:hypothetical protein
MQSVRRFCSRCVFPVCLISQLLNSEVAWSWECAEPQCLGMILGRALMYIVCSYTPTCEGVVGGARLRHARHTTSMPWVCEIEFNLRVQTAYRAVILLLCTVAHRECKCDRRRVLSAIGRLSIISIDSFCWGFWKGNEICSLSAQSIMHYSQEMMNR